MSKKEWLESTDKTKKRGNIGEHVIPGKNFILCGLTGWCIEVAFTSMASACKKDKKLMGQTSAWMFPIYGMAATILLIYPKIRHWHPLQRGLLYGLSILTAEYATGSLLSALDVCPWNYEGCRFSVNGLIRLDFLPLWMMAGLLFERLLLQTNPDV